MLTKNNNISDLRILCIFAHPDDEGFGSGGTLATLADQKAHITVVCATNGDVGEISDSSLATKETLGTVRQNELVASMNVTGIKDVRFLNYRDSGMSGSSDNLHPKALINAPQNDVRSRISEIISELHPNIIITHDPTGGYGHPDHKSICEHTTNCHLTSSNECLLYYVCFPKSTFTKIWQEFYRLGIKPPFASEDIESLGTPEEEVTTIIDVSEYVDIKISSLNCHRTQIDPKGPFEQLPKDMMRKIMSIEHYTLVSHSEYEKQDDILFNLVN